MKARCIIVEDEPQSAERLKLLLDRFYSSEVDVLGVVDNLLDFKLILEKISPELVFFDVQINDTDAFQMLQKLGHVNFEVIFTTGYSEFAASAFRIDAVDYLLKPIDKTELGDALKKFRKRIQPILTDISDRRVLDHIDLISGNKKITIHTLDGVELVSVNEIIRCQADVNYTQIFLKNGGKLTVSKTLKDFETILVGLGFLRVHNSSLVNLREIKSYHKGKGGMLTMSDRSEVEVSTRKKEDLLKALKSF